MNFAVNHAYLIPLLPLLAAVVAGFFGDTLLKGRAHWPVWIGVGCSAVLSLALLFGTIAETHGNAGPVGHPSFAYNWISAGTFNAAFGFYLDPLSVVMLSVVTGIGFLIAVFAAGYMHGESGYSRFFAAVSLFIFAMTCLVMADNLLLLYLGWEGVGLCSYLLIGYYYQRPAAAAAAKKAFVVNRVGDFGFAVGIMLCFYAFHTVTFFSPGHQSGLVERAAAVVAHAAADPATAATAGTEDHTQLAALAVIPFCLMLGAFGKSAQFPLYVWLPDAMEGPTPVSALIHAATMVTAGVYMIARCGTLFVSSHAAMVTVAVVGAFTALFAATIALRQFDLKKVFAYSTVSQLGYMFVGVGVLAPTAAVFHLVTHAFFKALLFLGSGVVMHAMLGHLDLRKMSGLRHVLPRTRWVILIGCLALAGCPLTSGFFSKDEIVGYAFDHSILLGMVLLFTSFLTAYYTFRLYFRVFEGPELVPTTPADADVAMTPTSPAHAEARASHEAVAHGSTRTSGVDVGQAHAADAHGGHGHGDPEPWVMVGPLVALAVGAVLIGGVVVRGSQLGQFLGHSPSFGLAYQTAVHAYHGGQIDRAGFGQRPTHAEEGTFPLGLVLGTLAFAAGISLAYLLHLRNRPGAERVAAQMPSLVRLLEGKYWVDPIYDAAIVRPLNVLGRWFFEIDRVVVDLAIGAVGLLPFAGGTALRLAVQRGQLQGYAATMLFGLVAILLLCFL